MKKIGIISDTHGLLRPEILGILKGCDCIIHAGDVNKPEILDTLRMMGSIYVVRGNNDKDWAEGMAKTLHFTIEGHLLQALQALNIQRASAYPSADLSCQPHAR